MASSSQAEVLKGEGNALFLKNDFSGAYKKYTAAIKLDKENAVLYCNRAACSYGLNRCVGRALSSQDLPPRALHLQFIARRYLDAAVDASKAYTPPP